MKLSKLKSEITDEGTWVELPEPFEGAEVLVRTTDHPDYTAAINLGLERKRGARKNPKAKREIVMRATAKHLILDWRGVEDDETGQSIPFDRERLLSMARDARNYGRFFDAVLTAAAEATDEIIEGREELGNS